MGSYPAADKRSSSESNAAVGDQRAGYEPDITLPKFRQAMRYGTVLDDLLALDLEVHAP